MNIIEEIKNKTDIVDIIQEYLPLTKKGKNYWGVCPFHNDSNPSMSVSLEKQIFTCFSCQASGNLFNFIEKIEKISFKEVLIKLSNKLDLEYNFNEKTNNYSKKELEILNALRDAMDYYRLIIETQEGEIGLKYIKERGVDAILREKFNIGYASKNKLNIFLKNNKKYDESVLMNSSLINNSGNDFFQKRIIFGISNEQNDIVGFSGRSLEKTKKQKYINSAETIFFKKNNILYNWNNAKEIATKKKEIIIVEGFMDVIAMYKAGYENVVAIMGTSLTKNNISKIKKLKVTLMLDSDNAGINATWKSLKLLLENKVKTFICINKYNKDPDEILKEYGKEKIKEILENKIISFEFIYNFLKEKYSSKDINSTNNFIAKFKNYFKYFSNIEKDYFLNKIEKDFSINKKNIFPQIKFEEKINKTKTIQKIEINFNKQSYKLIRTLIKNKELLIYYISKKLKPNFIDKKLITINFIIIKYWNSDILKHLKEYEEYVQNKINLKKEILKSKKEVDEVVKNINSSYKRYIIKLKKKKIKEKNG